MRQDALGDTHAGDVLHHKKINAILDVEVMDRGDVGVIDSRECQRFFPEALARCLVGKSAGGQHLDRDIAIEPLVTAR